MRDRLSALSAIVLLVVLAAVSYWYSVTAPFASGVSPVLPNKPDFIARGLSVTQFDAQGHAKNRTFSDYTEHFPDDRVVGHNVEMVTLSPDEPQTQARADRGESFNGGQKAIFTGNVRITRQPSGKDPGVVFTTSELTAYPDTETFVTDKPVHGVRGQDSTDGTGMVYEHAKMTVLLKSQVHSTMVPRHEPEQPAQSKPAGSSEPAQPASSGQ